VNQRSSFWKDFNWPVGLFIIGYHVALLVGLPIYFWFETPSAALVAIAIGLLFLTEIGIGAAYHRFYSHRAYELSRPAEAVLLFLATLATQGSALQWSFDHRRHHQFVDTDRDPYSIRKGFWYAHILWLFEKSRPVDPRRVPDLMKNPLVMFQHRHIGTLMIGSNALVAALIGWAIGDFLGAFVLAWITRMAVSHHLTWFVNSLAHCWGEKTYSKEHSAVDNYILAFLTVGEGYHNYHHTFAADYRNGVRWYHFDPTKWTIWTLSKLGLARNLRRFNRYRISKRLLNEDRRLLLAEIRQRAYAGKAELEHRVETLATLMQEKLNRINALADQLRELKKQKVRKHARVAIRREIRALRRSMKQDWKAWSNLSGHILAAQPT
jgi:stearoyl-CoA desaturase (delta-9 desaturase)